jgi:serine/threonine-protein kinase
MKPMPDHATLVDSSGAFDATLDSAAVPPTSGTGPAAQSQRATLDPRTTVLPRVEWAGDRSVVVQTARPRFAQSGTLGRGGIGEVIAAVDQDIGREVAIKRLREDVAGPAAVARFVDEIRTVGALEHPNILPIHDVGAAEDGSLYFVMPRVRGETLEAIIERLAAGDPLTHARWGFERRVHLFRQLLDAVAFAHERGFVHRDIKPANVMVGPYGEVFLMDWGIAKQVAAPERPAAAGAAPNAPSPAGDRVTATHAGALLGSPAYMSPEQARGEPVDARSDVYSLTVLLHELLYLRHYLDDCQTVDQVLAGVQRVEPPLLMEKHPHQQVVPADLAWFVKKGLSKDPAQRYQSAREMMERLDRRDEGVVPIQCHVTFTHTLTRRALRFLERHPLLFTLTLAAGVLAGVAAGVMRFVGH